MDGTTAEGDSSGMAESLARMARVLGQSSSMELPAARDQGLETWIIDEPIGCTMASRAWRAIVGGLDFRCHS